MPLILVFLSYLRLVCLCTMNAPLDESGCEGDIERREIVALKLELEQYATERGFCGSLCPVIAQYLQLLEGLYHHPGGFAFSNQMFQSFVAGANPLHTSRNELVLGGSISSAAQCPLCGLIFLGDLFPKSRDFAVSLHFTHEPFPFSFFVSDFFCLAALPHIQK